MSKLAAVLVPTFTILIISVSWLPSSFDPIVNWFGPLLGQSFLLLLGMVFFAFGNPLTYGVIFCAWALTGLILGVFARGLRSAIFAAFLVYTMIYAMLGISFGAVFYSLNSSGILHGNLPPVPPGTTTASLLNVPVFKQFAPLLLSGVSGAGSALGNFNLSSFIEEVLPSLVGGFVILLVFAVISGFAIGRVLKMLKPSMRKKVKLDGHLTSSPVRPATVPLIAKIFAIGVIVILGISIGASSSSSVSSDYYSESVLAFANPDGSATNYYAFVNDSFQVGSLSSTSLGPNIIAAMVASQAGSLSFLPESISSSLSQYISLAPATVLVLVYGDTCSSSSDYAGSASSTFASSFGIKDQSLLISRDTRVDQNIQNGCVFVYQSQENLMTMSSTFESSVIPAISTSGLTNILQSGLSSGFLIPGETRTSVNSSAIFAGYLDSSFVSQIPVIGEELSPSLPQGILGIVGAVAKQNNVFHSSSAQHTASFSELTEYSGRIMFSNASQFSLAGIAVPLSSNDDTSSVPNLSSYNFTLVTTNPSLLAQVVGQGQTIMNLNPGNSVTDSTLQAVFSRLLPAYISIEKTLTPNSNGTLTVTITVTNKDADTLTNLIMNDTAFTSAYANSMSIVSGQAFDSHVSTLSPSAVATYVYKVRLSGFGTYSSYPAILTYDLNGTVFSAFSNAAYYNVTRPSGASAIGMLAGSLGTLVNGGNPSSTYASLFEALFVAAFGIAGFLEFRAFRKWWAG